MHEELFKKLEQLKSIYKSDEDQKEISDLEKFVKSDLIRANLSQNPAILELVFKIKKLIVDLNKKLMTVYDMAESDRKATMLQRDAYYWFYSFFNNEEAMQNVEEFIEERLSNE